MLRHGLRLEIFFPSTISTRLPSIEAVRPSAIKSIKFSPGKNRDRKFIKESRIKVPRSAVMECGPCIRFPFFTERSITRSSAAIITGSKETGPAKSINFVALPFVNSIELTAGTAGQTHSIAFENSDRYRSPHGLHLSTRPSSSILPIHRF